METVLDEQKKGRIFKIEKEDVHGLAPKKSLWPFGGPFKSPFNIFSNNPAFSNKFGSLFEVGPSQEKSGLEGLNLMLTLANITKVYLQHSLILISFITQNLYYWCSFLAMILLYA